MDHSIKEGQLIFALLLAASSDKGDLTVNPLMTEAVIRMATAPVDTQATVYFLSHFGRKTYEGMNPIQVGQA